MRSPKYMLFPFRIYDDSEEGAYYNSAIQFILIAQQDFDMKSIRAS